MKEKQTMKDKKKKKQDEGRAAEKAADKVAEKAVDKADEEAVDETVDEGGDDDGESFVSELDEIKDKLLRALSENENNRRRFERETAEKVKYAHGDFAGPLLSVLDGFRQALVDEVDSLSVGDEESVVRWRDMLQGLFREMEQTFTQFGIVRIEAKRGDVFDYRVHEAVSESQDADVGEGHIVAQLRCGYQLHDRLLRAAMVVVRGSAASVGDEDNEKGGDSSAEGSEA